MCYFGLAHCNGFFCLGLNFSILQGAGSTLQEGPEVTRLAGRPPFLGWRQASSFFTLRFPLLGSDYHLRPLKAAVSPLQGGMKGGWLPW